MIPRVFHQIWLGSSPLPAEFAGYQETWRTHHPDWELRLWTEDELPPDLTRREVYETERSATERSDILRLELVWRHGGVYIDTDLESLQPIDPLLNGVDFFAGKLKETRVNNAIFGASAGHPILARGLETLRPQKIGAKFDKTASGALFFDALFKRGGEELTAFPPHFFYPSSPEERRSAYAIHHAARSWKNSDEWRETALKAERRLDQAKAQLEAERQAHEDAKRALAQLERQVGLREGTRPLRAVFFLRSIHFGRVLENFLREYLARGHELHIALELEKKGLGSDKNKLFEELRNLYAFTYEQLMPRAGFWQALGVAARQSLDYLRYLEPEFAQAEPLRVRARDRAPYVVRGLVVLPPFRWRPGRRLLCRLLRRLDRAIPFPRSLEAMIRRREPDVVLVSPVVGLGSVEPENIRAAHAAGVPTAFLVASWDNLTNKGLVHAAPSTTIVWNDMQVAEAVKLHGLPSESVVAVGAHSFDHWFAWKPSTSREEFATRMGLEPERPLLLYLGSSGFITSDETAFLRDWLTRVRSHPTLADAAVILRPHPYNDEGWAELGLEDAGKTVVWPKKGYAPTDDETRREYFDTLFHADAVVGINTTALVEAAILDRPVLTLISDVFATQEGTLHFAYLAEESGGPVTVARSWDQHLDQVASALAGGGGAEKRAEFLRTFVRPHGLEQAGASRAVDAVERTALVSVSAPSALLQLITRWLLAPFVPLLLPVLFSGQTKRSWSKSVRKSAKQLRKRKRARQKKRKRAVEPVRPSATDESRTAAAERRAEERRQQRQRAEPATRNDAPVAATVEASRNGKGHAVEELSELDLLVRELDKVDRDDKASQEDKSTRAAAREKHRRELADATRAPEPARTRDLSEEPISRLDARLDEIIAVLAQLESRVSSLDGAAKQTPPRRRLRPSGHSVVSRKVQLKKRTRKSAKSARRAWKLAKWHARTALNTRHRFTYRKSLAHVPSRDELPVLLNVRGLTGRGAEIGVKTGKFSERLLQTWEGEQLISIDPWLSVAPEEYVDRSNVSQGEFDENYEATKRRLARFASRSEIWRLTSIEGAAQLPDHSLDFAYIDARHDYESVLEDLAAWFLKVRPGGILAGHDYADGLFAQGDFGVKSAVDEFFAARGIPVFSTDGPSAVEMFPTWLVEIPLDTEVHPVERVAPLAMEAAPVEEPAAEPKSEPEPDTHRSAVG